MTMIEKMARAISAEQDGPRWWDSYTWGGHLKYKEKMMATARSALITLLKPSKVMLVAVEELTDSVCQSDGRWTTSDEAFRAAIQAALDEKP